jgi:hypothetical protein
MKKLVAVGHNVNHTLVMNIDVASFAAQQKSQGLPALDDDDRRKAELESKDIQS